MTNTNQKYTQKPEQYYISQSQYGVSFLVEGINKIPDNAIAISTEDYNDLLQKQTQGYKLSIVNNEVIATAPEPQKPTLESRLQELGTILTQKQEQGVYFKPASSDKAVLFASDADAQGRLFQALTLAKEGLWEDGSSYMLKDGSFVTMTSTDVQELAQKELQFYNSNNTNAHKLQIALQSDLNTDLTVGWASNE